jgi:hypothetical protein
MSAVRNRGWLAEEAQTDKTDDQVVAANLPVIIDDNAQCQEDEHAPDQTTAAMGITCGVDEPAA